MFLFVTSCLIKGAAEDRVPRLRRPVVSRTGTAATMLDYEGLLWRRILNWGEIMKWCIG